MLKVIQVEKWHPATGSLALESVNCIFLMILLKRKKKLFRNVNTAWILTLRKRPTFPSFVASNKNTFPSLNFFRESVVFLVSLGNSLSRKTRYRHAGDFPSWGFSIWTSNPFIIFWLSDVVAWLYLSSGGVSSLHLVISITSVSINRLSSESSTWVELESTNKHFGRKCQENILC